MKSNKQELIWSILRLVLGWILLWAFLDKLFGLSFNTAKDKSWIIGVSPTSGFLEFGTHGPFASIYKSLAGNVLIDWIFMIGILLIGLALIIGIFVRIASLGGALLMILMFLALIPPDHNPIIDEHIIYLIIFIGLFYFNSDRFSFGKYWAKTKLVKKYPILE